MFELTQSYRSGTRIPAFYSFHLILEPEEKTRSLLRDLTANDALFCTQPTVGEGRVEEGSRYTAIAFVIWACVWPRASASKSIIAQSGSVSGAVPRQRGSELLSCAGAILSLHWWTLHRTVGTKEAAVAWLGVQNRLASDAFVEKLASVSWHRLALSEAAFRAHQHGFKKNVDHINANHFKSHRNAVRKTSFPLFSTTAPCPTMIRSKSQSSIRSTAVRMRRRSIRAGR